MLLLVGHCYGITLSEGIRKFEQSSYGELNECDLQVRGVLHATEGLPLGFFQHLLRGE